MIKTKQEVIQSMVPPGETLEELLDDMIEVYLEQLYNDVKGAITELMDKDELASYNRSMTILKQVGMID